METQQDTLFQLKADLIPFTVLNITDSNLESLKAELTRTIKKAPKYFSNAPVVIDVSAISATCPWDVAGLVHLLRDLSFVPVALRGVQSAEREEEARSFGFAVLAKQPSSGQHQKAPQKEAAVSHQSPTKIVTEPVRSGSQVYARGGDLIILSAVNPGAECFADGSIHVYGPLRGRALAGINGDKNARIFCRQLDAELLAIAGHYQVNEAFCRMPAYDGMLEIALSDDALTKKII